MTNTKIHIIWGEQAVQQMKMGKISNLVLLAHSAYAFKSHEEGNAFLWGIRESRKPESWMQVTSVMEISKLGVPLKSRLFMAIQKGNPEEVEQVIAAGVDPNARTANGLTALHVAAIAGGSSVIKVLISKGADPNLQTEDNQHQTALHLITKTENPEAKESMDVILEKSQDVNPFDSEHKTPIIIALEKDNLELAVELLKNGANLDYEDLAGNSARSLFEEKFSKEDNSLAVEFASEIENIDELASNAAAKRSRVQHPSPYNNQ